MLHTSFMQCNAGGSIRKYLRRFRSNITLEPQQHIKHQRWQIINNPIIWPVRGFDRELCHHVTSHCPKNTFSLSSTTVSNPIWCCDILTLGSMCEDLKWTEPYVTARWSGNTLIRSKRLHYLSKTEPLRHVKLEVLLGLEGDMFCKQYGGFHIRVPTADVLCSPLGLMSVNSAAGLLSNLFKCTACSGISSSELHSHWWKSRKAFERFVLDIISKKLPENNACPNVKLDSIVWDWYIAVGCK